MSSCLVISSVGRRWYPWGFWLQYALTVMAWDTEDGKGGFVSSGVVMYDSLAVKLVGRSTEDKDEKVYETV